VCGNPSCGGGENSAKEGNRSSRDERRRGEGTTPSEELLDLEQAQELKKWSCRSRAGVLIYRTAKEALYLVGSAGHPARWGAEGE